MSKLEFNKIYVIESLQDSDSKTGQSLFNDTIKRRLEQKERYNSCELLMPNSKASFFRYLGYIKNQIIVSLVNPIIHLELHGSKDGLQLNNSEIISWTELQLHFIELNFTCKGNLFITLATCYGGYIFTVIKPDLRCPFWGFVGAYEVVSGDEVLENYSSFYDEFLQSFDFNLAVQALNSSNISGKSRFKFCNTEFVFNLAYNNYESQYLTADMVEKRLDSGLIEAKKSVELKNWTDENIKKYLRHLMIDKKETLKDDMMTKFFMWDVFPENRPK